MYQIGRIFLIDGEQFAFIDYQDDILVVYSLKDKELYYFRVCKQDFKDLYSLSKDNGMSKEAVHFLLKSKDKLKYIAETFIPGMKFIAEDGNEYVFLRTDKDKIQFKYGDNIYRQYPTFIEKPIKKFDKSFVNIGMPLRIKDSYERLSDYQKVMTGLSYCDLFDINIIEIGNVVKANAYSKEFDCNYDLIALQVRFSDYISGIDDMIGLFPIYMSIFGDSSPKSLDQIFKGIDFDVPNMYENDFIDSAAITEILISKDDIKALGI